MADRSGRLNDALRGRYVLERELGRGGMATVYLAHDRKHDRHVALKVLNAELGAALGPERFQREIRLAARLQHPHILTVLDSGEAAGQLWFTMPFVEGESLRDRLQREPQLALEDALRIAREAAQGLQYAHEHGVIHRDIKPENLLLTKDGTTLVADFGIARALGGDERVTGAGVTVGTPGYMSPEQASGDAALDARTDIYSLGCVLYEMLAGELPFTGPTAQVVIAKRLVAPAPSVRIGRPSVPEAIDHALRRAMAPVAADRFATAADFARALQLHPSPVAVAAPSASPAGRRIPAAALTLALGVLIGLGVLFSWRRTHETPPAHSGPNVLAVLPFENVGDSADAYFADGVAEEVRGKLSRIAGLDVIARTSSNDYRHTAKSPQEIARELGADYLLTATVRWEKRPDGTSRVRVTPELVEVGAGRAPRTRWQEAFDASLTDVFQVQADIATKVARALDVVLGDSARHELAAEPTASFAAYDAFLRGEAASQNMGATDPPSLRRAIAFYEQAVSLDSGFVLAWAQLARARAGLYSNGVPSPPLAAAAQQAARRAQQLGVDRPETALALAAYSALVEADFARALATAEAALERTPNDADLIGLAGLAEVALGRWDDARRHLTRAAALDPRSANTARRAGLALLFLRRYPEAKAAFDRALVLSPANLATIERRAMVSLAEGDLEGARAIVHTALATTDSTGVLAFFATYQDLYWVLDDAQQQRLLTLPPGAFDDDRAVWAIVRAQTYGLRGDRRLAQAYADSARIAIDEQLGAAPRDPQRHAFRGIALAYLGRRAEAIAEGQRATTLVPIARDANNGAYLQLQLARIYMLVGEHGKALDALEPLLAIPHYISPGWLRIDPNFAPLRGDPRFERLIAGS